MLISVFPNMMSVYTLFLKLRIVENVTEAEMNAKGSFGVTGHDLSRLTIFLFWGTREREERGEPSNGFEYCSRHTIMLSVKGKPRVNGDGVTHGFASQNYNDEMTKRRMIDKILTTRYGVRSIIFVFFLP